MLTTGPGIARKGMPILALLLLLPIGAFAQSDSTSHPAPAGAATEKPAAGKAHSDNSYVIGANDALAIDVWKEPNVSRSVSVRSDGKISLPLVGELQASGQTPQQLEQEITKRLQSYISEPEVTVIVTESKSQKVNILGMVVHPGAYLLTSSTTILDAVAMAGGFKDFAKQKSIYVLRPSPDGSQQKIRLQSGDTVVVP